MDDWKQNPYNVRHYIRGEHRRTRRKLDELRLSLLGVSEQLEEFQIHQTEALNRQRKIHSVVQVTAIILAVCAIVAVTIYLSS